MNWIKATDRLPEELPEYAGRKRIKCLVAYETQSGWNWKTILRYKVHDDWKWGEHLSPDYWCIPENPYQAQVDRSYELGTTTLHDLYYCKDIDADVVFTVKNAQGETIYKGDYDGLPSAMERRGVLKYHPSNLRAGFYRALEVWLA